MAKKTQAVKQFSSFGNTQGFVDSFFEKYLNPYKKNYRYFDERGMPIYNFKPHIIRFKEAQDADSVAFLNDSYMYEILNDTIFHKAYQQRQDFSKSMLKTERADGGNNLDLLSWIVYPQNSVGFHNNHDLQKARDDFKTVIFHFLRGIKLKMADLPNPWPICPVIWSGEHGLGKTILMRHITKIFEPFVADGDFEKMCQTEANSSLWADYFVLEVEELSGVRKADFDKVKKLMTLLKIVRRKFHTQIQEEFPVIASLIATSNKPSYLQITDNSGANRRFFDMEIYDTLMEDLLKQVDVQAIFESVPLEFSSSQESEYREKIRNNIYFEQEARRGRDDMDDFLLLHKITAIKSIEQREPVNIQELYALWIEFINFSGLNYKINRNKFKLEICSRLRVRPFHPNWCSAAINIDTGWNPQALDQNRTYIHRTSQDKLHLIQK